MFAVIPILEIRGAKALKNFMALLMVTQPAGQGTGTRLGILDSKSHPWTMSRESVSLLSLNKSRQETQGSCLDFRTVTVNLSVSSRVCQTLPKGRNWNPLL